jgi:outer membrane protein insertion porin family
MRKLRLSASALFLLSGLSGAAAQGPGAILLVEELAVEGNRRLSDEDILRHVRTRPGGRYDPAQVRRDLKALVALPSFDKTQTRVSTSTGPRDGIVVVFTVTELPVVRELTFPGLKTVSEADVLRAFRENNVGMAKEAIYDPVNVKRAQRVIRELLALRGRPYASVQANVEQVSAQSVALEFVIDEGPKGPPGEEKLLRPPRRKLLQTPQVARASHTGVEIDRK